MARPCAAKSYYNCCEHDVCCMCGGRTVNREHAVGCPALRDAREKCVCVGKAPARGIYPIPPTKDKN